MGFALPRLLDHRGFPDRRHDMRFLVAAIALLGYAALPQAASAGEAKAPHAVEQTARPSSSSQWPELLRNLGVNLIGQARAAECTPEGETCTSNEQCCPGLECSGGPPATCAT